MQIDRTTKILLALLVLGVWGLLLKPYVEPLPAMAQGPQLFNHSISWDATKTMSINLNVSGTTNGAPIRIQTK